MARLDRPRVTRPMARCPVAYDPVMTTPPAGGDPQTLHAATIGAALALGGGGGAARWRQRSCPTARPVRTWHRRWSCAWPCEAQAIAAKSCLWHTFTCAEGLSTCFEVALKRLARQRGQALALGGGALLGPFADRLRHPELHPRRMNRPPDSDLRPGTRLRRRISASVS